jgi:uncharacterized protein (DUF2062 family)
LPGKINFIRWIKYKYLQFIRIKDYPGSIAIGTALGISFDVLPTFGLGVIFAYLLATLLRVNRLAALLSAVVFKLAIPVFIYINVQTGQLFIKDNSTVAVELVSNPWYFFNWSHLGVSFLFGSIINAFLVFGFTFFATYRFVSWRRSRSKNTKKSSSLF